MLRIKSAESRIAGEMGSKVTAGCYGDTFGIAASQNVKLIACSNDPSMPSS